MLQALIQYLPTVLFATKQGNQVLSFARPIEYSWRLLIVFAIAISVARERDSCFGLLHDVIVLLFA